MARLAVIAPGRGSYNRGELGYIRGFAEHPRHLRRLDLLAKADRLRQAMGRPTISELDGATAFRSRLHMPGENASALIFTASAADYQLLSEKHRVVAVLGNSMGWYTTLFTGGALAFEDAFRVVDTMGWYQKDHLRGGQIIYPIVDESWRPDPEREAEALRLAEITAARGEAFWVRISIRLGGFLVFAGTDQGLETLMAALPKIKAGAHEYPFRLNYHGAFHTPLMAGASQHGLAMLKDLAWGQPHVPMIDGRGFPWRPYQSDPAELTAYTLVEQVLEPFDFTASVRVALRETNPDHVVLLGPGDSLGGAVAQIMIAEGWRGLDSKKAFLEAQKDGALPLISMNRPEQAARVI